VSADPAPQAILNLPLDAGDVTDDYSTVGGYLKHVGLNPAGGDWKWPLYVALAVAGVLPGVAVDPGNADGDVLENFPESAQARADILIDAAVKALEAS
jgi:hypothetical protein